MSTAAAAASRWTPSSWSQATIDPTTAELTAVKESDPMNANKALWEKGDFTRIAESMRDSGEALVKDLAITNGLQVLDLGCGDGTTALPAARLGADVLGVDIAANLVDAGNRRAAAEGLTNCRFQEGDASDLHDLRDDSFDLVVSIFGAMFAPKPFDVAKEMVRVTRPGGRIVMGNWIPERSDARRADPEDQQRVRPASTGRFHQPHDVGGRSQRHRALHRDRSAGSEHLVRPGHVPVRLPRVTVGAPRRVPQLLRADDERLRSCGSKRSHRRAADTSWRSSSIGRTRARPTTRRRSPRRSSGSALRCEK